jgi:superoxide dismutase, Cu-Zn family
MVTLNKKAPLLDQDGSALVIHAGVDDYVSDPAGNAGDRIACGVVTP